MLHPYLKNITSTLFYFAVWVVAGSALGAALTPLPEITAGYAIPMGIIFGAAFGAATIPLWGVAVYGKRIDLENPVRLIWNGAVYLITLLLWYVCGFGVAWLLFPEGIAATLVMLTPVLLLVGSLGYLVILQHYGKRIAMLDDEQERTEEQAEEEQEAQQPEVRETLERIAVKSGQKIEIAAVTDIVYIKAEGDYVLIHTTGRRFMKEQTMKYFEQNLPPELFARVHRSYIVNVKFISRVERYDKQELVVVLSNGQKVRASQNGYRTLKRLLDL